MIEEPYRWLEAMGNRREYVREQLKGGSPVFGVKMPEGVLLLGIGTGNSKVFELFDRHALAGLGHPADIEKIRQAAIDAAHMEAFNRAPEDVSLRRLVSFGLSPQLKTSFEQVFGAPFLVELLLVELAASVEDDVFLRLHFDGTFQFRSEPVIVAASSAESEAAAEKWLADQMPKKAETRTVCDLLLQAWWLMMEKKSFTNELPDQKERRNGWKEALKSKTVEIGWLTRDKSRRARFEFLNPNQLDL